ncbi:F-box protein at5g07670 [Phtheirospermum japonicum]|uniref:F-box protein at5g07670 n=1 Tax=Phtheirospermum japonicum TaxID=374723 RepID=A0A830BFI7_9LAMI|nr:F-box protein at5g07670 [Phtheirospermum japonicum]
MAFSPAKENQQSLWFKNKKALNNVLFAMRLNSLTPEKTQIHNQSKTLDFTLTNLVSDKTSLLSDEILLKILSNHSNSQKNANSLVSKRWLNLQGRLVRSIKLLDWDFLISGRLFLRFPNLIHVDLVNACLISSPRNSGVYLSHKIVSFHVSCDNKDWVFDESNWFALSANEVDKGLSVLANGYPNLRKLIVINASETGLLNVANECPTLQELELHMCNDRILSGISACKNLQILKLSGTVDGIYKSSVSDVGLIVLAHGCKRLVKLELSGCKGSYEGIRAIGLCCQMIEELTFCDHRMENGWILALSYCENLKSLRFMSCKRIDGGLGMDEDTGFCRGVESLCFEKCQLRDKKSLGALFVICRNVRDVVVKNCWGLSDDMFGTASGLRRVRSLSLEGCSLLTTHGLEFVIISWNELKSLKVKSCNNIKDAEVSDAFSSVFSSLQDWKWDPDTKSVLSANLSESGMGKKGVKFFKKPCDWKSLPGS